MTFGEKLREARKEKGMTQEELALSVGLGRRAIVQYESGKSYPRQRKTYELLAKVLNISESYLLTEDKEPQKRVTPEIINDVCCLFSGGETSEEDKDAIMRAMMEAYIIAKKQNETK